MSASPLDSPPYVPEFPPQTPLVDVQQAQDWVRRELEKIARYTTAQPGTLFSPNNAPPTRPRTGMEAYADGVNWNPGSGEGLYVFKGGLWVPVGVGAGSRVRLASATTYYIATNGSDSNNGTSSGTPWLTFAHAMAVLTGIYDFGGQAVTLQAVAGHAAFTSTLSISPWVGGGSLTYDGASGSIITTGSDHAIQTSGGALPGPFTFQNVALTAGGSCMLHPVPGTVNLGAGVTFNAADTHLRTGGGGGALINLNNNYTVAGAASRHYQIALGQLNGASTPITVTVSGTPAFGFFALCTDGFMGMQQVTFSGAATGQRYRANQNGIISTGGQGPNFFPGNVAGDTNTGGQYS